MFDWIKNLFASKEEKEARLNAKYAEEDMESNYIRGRRTGNTRKYSNGIYGTLSKDKSGEEKITLYTPSGKMIDNFDADSVFDWHHGFVMIDWTMCDFDEYIDCRGNRIFCHGVFIENKDEIGDKLWLVPVRGGNKYILYNHEDYIVGEIEFSGVKRCEDGNYILGVTDDEIETSGYGSLGVTENYKHFYKMDFEGNIVDEWREKK